MSHKFGEVRQVGYIVKDIEAAMRKWVALGVGPWYYRETNPVSEFSYYGEASAFPDVSIALANSGQVQIELIQQRNEAPSLYRDMILSGQEGIQHIAYWTEDQFDAFRALLLSEEFVEGHAGRLGKGGRFAYFTNPTMPGTIIELSETTGGKMDRFKLVREAAERWDGSDPIRKMTIAA